MSNKTSNSAPRQIKGTESQNEADSEEELHGNLPTSSVASEWVLTVLPLLTVLRVFGLTIVKGQL